ncbi:MvaI/BcnI family restriction endonuclease [Rickettsia australis]|uniref:MvaI/BcnI family restriction endonuclease n=1 Tax=Rickettsia australis TaxID=787 RepID=UPI001930BCDC|nr:MvaI/BcnI family restriction endonuclease [Rickettsia australis]
MVSSKGREKYPIHEKSFRQTISILSRSDRGFKVVVDRLEQKVLISFDAELVANHHKEWLLSIEKNIGLKELNPQPYWGF